MSANIRAICDLGQIGGSDILRDAQSKGSKNKMRRARARRIVFMGSNMKVALSGQTILACTKGQTE